MAVLSLLMLVGSTLLLCARAPGSRLYAEDHGSPRRPLQTHGSSSCVYWHNNSQSRERQSAGWVETAGWKQLRLRENGDRAWQDDKDLRALASECNSVEQRDLLQLRWCSLANDDDSARRPPESWLRTSTNAAGIYALAACIVDWRGCPTHGSSIGAEYVRRARGRRNAMPELYGIVLNRACSATPDPASLVVHLRLGDAIELSDSSVAEMLLSGASPLPEPGSNASAHLPIAPLIRTWESWAFQMRTGIKSVQELLFDAEDAFAEGADASLASRHVDLVGGSHRDDFVGVGAPKSWAYAHCVRDAFEQAGYSVSLRTELDADDAFCFMARAKMFVPSPGRFSRVISHLVELDGGRVIGRRF